MPYFEDFGSHFHFDYLCAKHSGNLAGMHIHPHYEVLIMVHEVEQTPQINGIICPQITKPSLSIFPPFSMHRVQFPHESRNERFCFYFGKPFIEEFSTFFKTHEKLMSNVFLQYTLSPELLEQVVPLLREMVKHQDDTMYVKFGFMTVLCMILNRGQPEYALSSTKDMDKMGEVVQYMVEHCRENLTCEKVAKHFFISRSKLNQDFKEHIKIGFHELLVEIKLHQAFYMLKSGKKSIRDISAALGFEQENYFNTFFKRTTGMTPLQYRKATPEEIDREKKKRYNAEKLTKPE